MTNIQWTDVTDNPIRVTGGGWWCQKVSEGCTNCYAETWNNFRGNKLPYSGKPPNLQLDEQLLASWSRMRKPKKHFVGSMTDIFGDWVDINWQFKILDAMWNSPLQTFQLLTKRPSNMYVACHQWMKQWGLPQMPDNIWLGVTTENQKSVDDRIRHIRDIPAPIRFLSCEPLLEEINLIPWLADLQWVIVGGESGTNARYCHLDWIQSVVSQCQKSQVPIFVKQLGYKAVDGGQRRYDSGQLIVTREGEDGNGAAYYYPISDRKGGNISDFPPQLQVRLFPGKSENF